MKKERVPCLQLSIKYDNVEFRELVKSRTQQSTAMFFSPLIKMTGTQILPSDLININATAGGKVSALDIKRNTFFIHLYVCFQSFNSNSIYIDVFPKTTITESEGLFCHSTKLFVHHY